MKPTLLVINAALNGPSGNTAVLLDQAAKIIRRKAEVLRFDWTDASAWSDLEPSLRRAQAIMLGTGTHWDSWSHSLQRLLEDATPSEGTSLWLGKPAAVVVTMHSVGGKGTLSRLQGVLNTFGCLIPPMSGLVYSLANQASIKTGAAGSDDLWCRDDIKIVCHNVLAALDPVPHYRAWPVDRQHFSERWID